MSKLKIALLVASSTAFVSSAVAQFTDILDDFSAGTVVSGSTPDSGVGNWTNGSGTSGAITISAGQALLPSATSELTQLNFNAANQTSGTYYLGFDFTVNATGSIGTSNTIQSVIGFRSGTAGSGTNTSGFGVFRPSGAAQTTSGAPSTTTSEVVVGIFSGSDQNASTSDLANWATALTRGTTYRAVIGLDLTADTMTLWINPTTIASTSVSATGITGSARGIFLRSGSSSTGDILMDNLIGSTSFSTASAVPEPSSAAALAGLAVLGLVATRRRRAV